MLHPLSRLFPRVTVNDDREFVVEGGGKLLDALMREEIFIPSACGGRGSCGLCKVKVTSGGGPLLPTETPYLVEEEVEASVRLSCQVKVREDVAVRIPEELLEVKAYRGVVTEIERLTHDVVRIAIELLDPDEIDFEVGQYIQLETPAYGPNPEPVYRAYSIASLPGSKTLEFLIRRAPDGICTTWIFEILREGDTVTFNGPYGEFLLTDEPNPAVFICGATGLAPIWPMLNYITEHQSGRKCQLYFGVLSRRDVFYDDKLSALAARNPNLEYYLALSKPAEGETWEGETGLITDVAERHMAEVTDETEAYLCGSPAMIDACIDFLKGKGTREGRIFFDKFT